MRQKHFRWALFFIILIVLLILSILLSLSVGEVNISLSDLSKFISEKKGMEYIVLSKIRVPRIVLGFSVGGALSLSGVLLQGIYRNPLVEPYTLGISGGAALGVALAIVFNVTRLFGFSFLPISGFTGALSAVFIVFFLSSRRGKININNMLLIGVMVSFVCSSAMMFLMSITTRDNLHSIVFWTMGSLDEPDMAMIKICFYVALSGLVISIFFARPLNALRLGQEKARHLGIHATVVTRIVFILASLLTGICVSVAGIIGFIGLVIPHLVRSIIGSDFRILLIGSFLGGSFFLVLSDVAARTVISPSELPVGVITGIAGGVIFIFILTRSQFKSKLD